MEPINSEVTPVQSCYLLCCLYVTCLYSKIDCRYQIHGSVAAPKLLLIPMNLRDFDSDYIKMYDVLFTLIEP
jgi:hypothetical protein